MLSSLFAQGVHRLQDKRPYAFAYTASKKGPWTCEINHNHLHNANKENMHMRNTHAEPLFRVSTPCSHALILDYNVLTS